MVLETVALDDTSVEQGNLGDGADSLQQQSRSLETVSKEDWKIGEVLEFWFGGSASDNMKNRYPEKLTHWPKRETRLLA